jgi:hypothetical protein
MQPEYLILNETALKNCTQGLGCHMEVPILTSRWRESSFAMRSSESNFSNNNGMQNSVKSGEAIRQGKRAVARSSRVMAFGVSGICCREIHSFNNLSAKWTNYTVSSTNTWRFGNTAVSGTVGMGNLSLSILLARIKAFQLSWSAGL